MLGATLQGLSVFALLASLVPTFWHGYKWNQRNTEKLGFKWGYFVAYSTVFFYVFVLGGLLAAIIGSPRGEDFKLGGILAVSLFVIVLVSFMAIKRRRWALILVTLLSLNPLWMIINVFYLKNRWGEFREEAAGRSARPST